MSRISLPVRRHERVGGTGVAQLREQRRVHQFGDERAAAERRELRLGAADDGAVARGDRAQTRLPAVDDCGDADVDRLGREDQAGAAQAADLEIEAAAAIALPRIIDAARRRAGEVEVGPEQVEHLQRHVAELGVDFGRGAAAAGNGRVAAGEADAGRCQRPAVAGAGENGGLVEHQWLALDAAIAGELDAVGLDIGQRRESEGGATAAGESGADLPDAVDQLGIGGQPGKRDRAERDAAPIDGAVDGGAIVGEDDGAVGAAAANREGILEHGAVGGEVRVDPLRLPRRREVERAGQRSVGEQQAAPEAAGQGGQAAGRVRAAGIERGNGDRRRRTIRQQDLAVGGEWTQPRAAAGAVIVARGDRIEQQAHVGDAHRLVRTGEQQVDLRSLDMAVEDQLERAVFGLAAAGDDVEGAVLQPLAGAGQPQLGRIELQVGEVDNAVAAALEVGGQRRQAAGQVAEEAIVETADPRLAGADDVRALPARSGFDAEVGGDIDDAEAGDQVALHRARKG